jgi:phage tail protein X
MNKILSKDFRSITLALGAFILLVGCDSLSEKKTMVEECVLTVPSFSDTTKEKVGCSKDKACSKENPLSSEDVILESLMKNHSVNVSQNIGNEHQDISQALISLVEDSELKKQTNVKKNLEFLVSTANDFAEVDEKSIGTFDIEKFSSTWQELQSLVDNSEETQKKKMNLRKDLEVLVVSASSDDEDIEKVEEKVKALLDISSNISSVEEVQFTNTVMSEISHKNIDLLEANKEWIKVKIRSGDTLSSYAEKYYGDANKYKIIYEANKDVIDKNYTLHVGSILIIPTLNSIQGI